MSPLHAVTPLAMAKICQTHTHVHHTRIHARVFVCIFATAPESLAMRQRQQQQILLRQIDVANDKWTRDTQTYKHTNSLVK